MKNSNTPSENLTQTPHLKSQCVCHCPRGRLLVPPLGGSTAGSGPERPDSHPLLHMVCVTLTCYSAPCVFLSLRNGGTSARLRGPWRGTRDQQPGQCPRRPGVTGPWQGTRDQQPGPRPRRPGEQVDLAGRTAPQTSSRRKSFGFVFLTF